jgi:dolichyl-phosphate beta-glucosyltransferase
MPGSLLFVKLKIYPYNKKRFMKLSLVIPAYNEAARIEQSLAQIFSYLAEVSQPAEIIVVDDGSTDTTGEKVQAMAARRPNLRLLRLPRNLGKGAAVKAGVLASQGDWVLMSDADLSTPLTELPRFLAALTDGFDLVIGSRQLPQSKIVRHQPRLRQQAGLMFGSLVRKLIPVGVVDTQCGFKLLRGPAGRELFQRLTIPGFCFDVELLVLAQALGFRVAALPVTWEDMPGSKVSLVRHLPRVARELLRIRWNLWRGIYRP